MRWAACAAAPTKNLEAALPRAHCSRSNSSAAARLDVRDPPRMHRGSLVLRERINTLAAPCWPSFAVGAWNRFLRARIFWFFLSRSPVLSCPVLSISSDASSNDSSLPCPSDDSSDDSVFTFDGRALPFARLRLFCSD